MSQVVIIGGGQAGLAMSYSLQQLGVAHILLEANHQIGDNWRHRWDSLSLFSPAKYDALPGLQFPLPPDTLPSKDQAADYLEQYAQQFQLPVRTGVQIDRIAAEGAEFCIHTSTGEVIPATDIVVATGPYHTPKIPEFAAELPSNILQMHTQDYRNPSQMQDGPAVVIGTGASGSQIALELSHSRKVYIAGRDLGGMPRSLLGKDLYWWLYATGAIRLRWNSWIGRRLLKGAAKGDALVGDSLKKIVAKGNLTHLQKVTGVHKGQLTFACGNSAPEIRNVIWATGYHADYSWINLPVFEPSGLPRHQRGIVTEAPGLYFLGLKTLYRTGSATMGGVGADAQYLARHIAEKSKNAFA